MDSQAFYRALLRPIEAEIGAADRDTLTGVIGFDAGGPVSLTTFGSGDSPFVTYVTCELALRSDLKFGSTGPFELMLVCDDEDWSIRILTQVAEMALECTFDDGHTLDVGAWVEPSCPVQGLLIELHSSPLVDGRQYAILRLHGVDRRQLERARAEGTARILEERRAVGVFPRTAVRQR